MTRLITKLGLSALIAGSLAGAALAEGEWSGNVALGTEYVWRGITQSQGDVALSGGFDYANGIFYAGTWASNVDFGDASDTNMEVDLYGGIASEFSNGVTWDVGVIGYLYPDADDEDLDFVEVYGGLGYAFEGGVEVGGSVNYDPDNQNTWIDATAAYSFTDAFSADAMIGNYSFDGGGDYTGYAVGATYSIEGFDLDLRLWGNDIDETGVDAVDDLLDQRIVFTVSRSL